MVAKTLALLAKKAVKKGAKKQVSKTAKKAQKASLKNAKKARAADAKLKAAPANAFKTRTAQPAAKPKTPARAPKRATKTSSKPTKFEREEKLRMMLKNGYKRAGNGKLMNPQGKLVNEGRAIGSYKGGIKSVKKSSPKSPKGQTSAPKKVIDKTAPKKAGAAISKPPKGAKIKTVTPIVGKDAKPVTAKLAAKDGSVKTNWGSTLKYRKGKDYVLEYGPNDYGVVRADIFKDTYTKQGAKYVKNGNVKLKYFVADKDMTVKTLEGTVKAKPGDHVMIGTRGEMWPVKAAKFKQKYKAGPAATGAKESVKTYKIPVKDRTTKELVDRLDSTGNRKRFQVVMESLARQKAETVKEVAKKYLRTTVNFKTKKSALEAIRDSRAGQDRLNAKLAAS